MLAAQDDDDGRWPIVNALGFLGGNDTADQLAALYGRADEDERYYLLKALHYLGRSDLAARQGTNDDKAGRVLYDRIAAFAARLRKCCVSFAPLAVSSGRGPLHGRARRHR